MPYWSESFESLSMIDEKKKYHTNILSSALMAKIPLQLHILEQWETAGKLPEQIAKEMLSHSLLW